MQVGRAAGRIEKLGIPTISIIRHEFVSVADSAIAGMGFPPETPKVIFPVDLFLVESDLSVLSERLDEFIAGLTTWTPEMEGTGIMVPPMITVQGENYERAIENLNALFLQNLWGDGLPILPATEERVEWMLRGTDLSRDTVVGAIDPQGGLATAETIAVALAMAGGRPEYMPVLIAAVEALADPELFLFRPTTSSNSAFPVVIVNGPVAKAIRLNSGFGLMGPRAEFPAGGSIGRALRLIMQNVGGAIPGQITMAEFGGMRYTNAVFAEDEDRLPEGWEPLNVEYFGYPRGTNTVAVAFASGVENIFRRTSASAGEITLEEEALQGLHRVADFMKAPNHNIFDPWDGSMGILIYNTLQLQQMADLGWTKESIKEFLWENTKLSMADLERTGLIYGMSNIELTDPLPMSTKPENLMLVAAGGRHPSHSYWMEGSGHTSYPVAKEIELPADWEQLLKEAEEDLGPMPLGDQ